LEPAVGFPVSTYLVSGFLGAGKTTFILERLRDTGGRIAVLVNEFGTLGIDGQTIRTQGGMDVVEMAGGCICCSQRQDLIKTVAEIARDIRPDVIMIEPSGVAETSELLTALFDPSLAGIVRHDATIAIIDAITFLEYSEPGAFGTFFLDQVQSADIILINKIDLVEPGALTDIETRIAGINPRAAVLKTDHCRDTASHRVRGVNRPIPSRDTLPEFSALTLELRKPVAQASLQRFLSDLEAGTFGEIFRAKGFVPTEDGGCVEVQVTPGQVSTTPAQCGIPSKIIFIGRRLERSSLERYFAAGGALEAI